MDRDTHTEFSWDSEAKMVSRAYDYKNGWYENLLGYAVKSEYS